MKKWSEMVWIHDNMPEECMDPRRTLATFSRYQHGGPGTLCAAVILVTPTIHIEVNGKEEHAICMPLQRLIVLN